MTLSALAVCLLAAVAGCLGDVPSAGSISMPEAVIKKAEKAREPVPSKKKSGRATRPTSPRR